MKKLCALMIAAMACSMVACDDSDNGKTIEDCYPTIYTQSKALNDVMVAAGTEKNVDVCTAKAEAMAKYIEDNKSAFEDAGRDYTDLAKKENWDSVSDILCTAYGAMLRVDSYNMLKNVQTQIDDCAAVFAADGTDEGKKQQWSNALQGLTSVEGWEAALKAAMEQGSSQSK